MHYFPSCMLPSHLYHVRQGKHSMAGRPVHDPAARDATNDHAQARHPQHCARGHAHTMRGSCWGS